MTLYIEARAYNTLRQDCQVKNSQLDPRDSRGMMTDVMNEREGLRPTFGEMRPPIRSKSLTSNYANCHPDRQRVSQAGRCAQCHIKFVKYNVDFLELYKEQDGHCKLCQENFSEDRLHIDHNHTTKAVRGLLCHSCNRRVGVIETFTTSKYDSFFDVLEYIGVSPSLYREQMLSMGTRVYSQSTRRYVRMK